MLIRLRRSLGFLVAGAIGFALASTVVVGAMADVYHMGAVALAGYRLRAGSSGTLWMLVGGFLLGQALVLATQRTFRALAPSTSNWAEKSAWWDAAMLLPTRFGLQRYLEACSRWLVREKSDSMQSVALLKIVGLGKFNERGGSQAGTVLLQRIAGELRVRALAKEATPISKWLARHLPRRFSQGRDSTPDIRCAARWSGSTFALAFRGLEADAAFFVVRELATWIRAELASMRSDSGLELRVAFAMGPAGASPDAITTAAGIALAAADSTTSIPVAMDPKDGRAPLFAAVPNLRRVDVSMPPAESPHPKSSSERQAGEQHPIVAFIRGWGLVFLCLAGVPTVLAIGAGKSDYEKMFPWPQDMQTLPVVDASGSTEVKLVSQKLEEAAADGWKVSGQITQAEAAAVKVRKVEFRIDITNLSSTARYVSLFDFVAVDAVGNELEFDIRKVMKYAQPIDGRWLDPGESWSGWAYLGRESRPVTGLVFKPSAHTRLLLRSVDKGAVSQAPAFPGVTP